MQNNLVGVCKWLRDKRDCTKFQSLVFNESEVIQILKVVRWHSCEVYMPWACFCTMRKIALTNKIEIGTILSMKVSEAR